MASVFSEVLKMSLSAGFLVGIVIGLRWCFRRVPKWVHCILWALVAVRLICPDLPQSHLSMVPEQVSDGRVIVQVVEDMPRLTPSPAPAPQETPAPLPDLQAPDPAQDELPAAKAPIPWMTILSGLWLAGAAVMGLYALYSYRKILKKVGPCIAVGHNIYLCDYIDTPFLLGFHKPRIYLPSYLNTETAAYVLAHERAHIARRDHWWKPIGFVLLSFHWFNPMIWVGYILLCRDIEMACDEAVVKTMGSDDKKGYSTALLRCSLPRRTVSICPLAFGEVSVKERIKSVLHYKKPALWLTLVGLTAVILGCVFFLTDPEKQKTPKKVEYLPTAVYVADRDELTITEYDSEYRPRLSINYDAGVEDIRQEYSYKRRGDKLTRTVVCTHAPVTNQTEKPGIHSTSIDGVDVRPGQTVTMVYEENLDANDNVLESVLTVDGNWFRTQTFTYDENGNVLTQSTDGLASASAIQEHRYSDSTFTYDALGNMLSKKNIRKSLSGTDAQEQNWTRDEQGNVLQFQMIHNGKVSIEDRYTLDDTGRPISRVTTTSGGTATTYSISRNEAEGMEIIAQNGADGTSTGFNFYDQRENWLSGYTLDENGNCILQSARNYIGTDGFKSTGIPEEIYKEGKPVHANPEIYSIPVPAGTPCTLPSARYDGRTGMLTLFEYDKDHRVSRRTLWQAGRTVSDASYSYDQKGSTLTVTEQQTADGKKSAAVYTRELDENGNVTKSTLYRDGQWDSTYLYTYFTDGKLQSVVGINPRQSFRLLNDQFGQKIRYLNGAYREADVPTGAVWQETPEMQDKICEKWYLPGMVEDLLYFHDFDRHLLELGEYHDDQYSWNGGSGRNAEGNLDANVQIRRWEDSSLAEGQTIYYGQGTEPLWKEIYDNEWCAFNNNYFIYYNYISGDGEAIVTIPEDLYHDAAGKWRTAYSYTPSTPEGIDRTMDYVEVDNVKFWFDSPVSEEERLDCISATNRINNAVWSDTDPEICVLADLEKPYVQGSTLYTAVRDFRSRDYAADVITAANGEHTLYGLAYGYANFLCDKLGWQKAEPTDFVMPANKNAADLNSRCFDEDAASQADIAAAKRLACGFVDNFLRNNDKNNFFIRLWMSNDPEDMERVCDEIEAYYAANGFDYRPAGLNAVPDGDEWAGSPDGIRFEEYSGSTYKAHVMIVRDPGTVYLGASSPEGFSRDIPGKRINEIMESEQALAAVNASAFFDDGTASAKVGSTPEDLVFSGGECLWENGTPPNTLKGFAGFDKDNVLIVKNENITRAQAEELNIRDGCCFGPVLLTDGNPNPEADHDRSGYNPRTAIGQRADGAVIFVCIDGRQVDSLGGTYADLIEIMTEFGAVNACAMGGGSSSVMMYRDTDGIFGEAGKLTMISNYSLLQGEPRRMPTYWMVRPAQ